MVRARQSAGAVGIAAYIVSPTARADKLRVAPVCVDFKPPDSQG